MSTLSCAPREAPKELHSRPLGIACEGLQQRTQVRSLFVGIRCVGFQVIQPLRDDHSVCVPRASRALLRALEVRPNASLAKLRLASRGSECDTTLS